MVNILLDYLIPKQKINYIRFKHISMFGPPDTGKTTFGFTLASKVEQYALDFGYPFRCYHALDLETILNYIEEKNDLLKEMYLFFFIDDAEVRSSSVRTRQTLRNIGLHDTIRHRLNALGMQCGYVALLYATQRYQNLTPTLRNADVIILKGVSMLNKNEIDTILSIAGRQGLWYLRQWIRYIRVKGLDMYKGYALVKMIDGRRRVVKLSKPKKPKNLVELWHPPLQLKKQFRDKIKAELLKIYSNLEKIPYNPVGRPPYHYINIEWLKSIKCTLGLSHIGRLTKQQVKTVFFQGMAFRAVVIYNMTEFKDMLRKALSP